MTTAKALWLWFKQLSLKDKAAIAVWPALVLIVVLSIWIDRAVSRTSTQHAASRSARQSANQAEEFSFLNVVRATGCQVNEAAAEKFATVTWPRVVGIGDAGVTGGQRGTGQVTALAPDNEGVWVVGKPCPDRRTMEQLLTSSAVWKRTIKDVPQCEGACEKLVDFWQRVTGTDDASLANDAWLERYEKAQERAEARKRAVLEKYENRRAR